ncbi:lysis system i-spanin subunit Rz [Pseudomonas fluorescens]|uniref:lysis system i-spanin subunit Rz n=1 Tax=Pseudomonas fluorescens TaxID=294 RepID=UPI001BE965C3|nr:lysis system i-spanin subunit Rz [Pseudomonas fluorescens]MBT2375750.1 lysis protein [Pseudomonas fluorescens]
MGELVRQYKFALILFSCVLLIGIGAGAAWQVQDWRMGKQLVEQAAQFQTDLSTISNAATAQARAEQDKRLSTEQALAIADQQHTKELSDAQREQARLRDRLATADVRLSVVLAATDATSSCSVPTTTATGRVVHGTTRAELDPAYAQRIIGITDAGDQGLIALRACQAYAKEVSTPK